MHWGEPMSICPILSAPASNAHARRFCAQIWLRFGGARSTRVGTRLEQQLEAVGAAVELHNTLG